MNKYNPFLLPLLRTILFIISGYLFVYITKLSFEDASRFWPLICIFVNIITLFVLSVVCRKDKITYRSLINYQSGELRTRYTLWVVMIMMVLGIGGMVGFGYLIYGYIPVIMIQPLPIGFAIITLILLPITVVLAELPLYFGYALNGIDKITKNKTLAIVYPMFFYALQHSFIPLLFNWQHIVFRFLAFLPLLIILGFVYHKHRRLSPLMLGHGILDFAAAAQIMIVSLFPALFDLINIT